MSLRSRPATEEGRVSDRFDALNALYVLCALGDAKIDRRYRDVQLYFNLR